MSAAQPQGAITIATAEPGFDVVLLVRGRAVQLRPQQAIDLGMDLLRFGRLANKRIITNSEKWIDT